MYFREIIGQEKIKEQLLSQMREGRIPHAQLFFGPKGVGKLPLAIAYARYLCCENRGERDACGKCSSCIKFNHLVHPDLHFSYPVIKKKSSSADNAPVSDDYIAGWRQQLQEMPYFSYNDWMAVMGAENQQALIYARESDLIFRKLMFKPSEGGYKILIMWMPEKMNVTCANKLLKLLEEPPSQTLFFLITEYPDQLLTTIQSRVQRIQVPMLSEATLSEGLQERFGLSSNDAALVAHRSMGSWLTALETIKLNEENEANFEMFTVLMRLAYQRKIREMKQWSEQVAAMGRERQKNFLNYCQRMIRENFVYNFKQREMVYLSAAEQDFSTRFAPFVNEKNIMGLTAELSEAQIHIEQNVNSKMVFFDLILKMTILIKNR